MSDNENTKPTTEVQGDDKKKARKMTKVDSYATYIYKVLKQVHPKRGISRRRLAIWLASITRALWVLERFRPLFV